MDFRKQVEEKIKDFSKEQMVAFAWRCAVRALPFLAHDGHFNFWEEKNLQKYLYTVLNAIDYGLGYKIRFSSAASDLAAANAAITASKIAVTTPNIATATIFTAAYAAQAVVAIDAVAASITANSAIKIKFIDFESQIFSDIKAIQDENDPQITIETYGATWSHFIKALEDSNCEYWAKWYKQLFKNNFEFNIEEVKQRLHIPDEIKAQGAAAVGEYMVRLQEEGGGQRLNEARIIILGDKGAGKTCVARKLIDPNAAMATPAESTSGVDMSTWKLTKENMNVSIWDFAGHTVTHAVHQFFLSERSLYILVYNGRTEDTSSLEYWLDHMKNYGGDSEAIILVNERDKHHNDIPVNRLKEQYAIAGVYYLNVIKDTQKFKKFRNDVADYIVNNPSWKNQEIPKSYYAVKEELEQRFAKNKNGESEERITRETFDTIAQKHEIEDSERLLQDLHALGVSLWYKGMEQYNTIILNPEWISDGVYQIINWVHNQKTHEITLSDFKKVFAKDKKRYPADQYHFLFDLILNYELAYKTDKGNKLIIPHLLKEDQPANLPNFEIGGSLMLKYKADQALPPHTISRFIVKHSDQIKKHGNDYLVWRYGVVLEDNKGSVALVREWNRTIDVSVKGPTKTAYISQLRETLNTIFDGYKSKKPELQYNISQIGTQYNTWLSEKSITGFLMNNRDYYDPITNEDIPLKNLVNIIDVDYSQLKKKLPSSRKSTSKTAIKNLKEEFLKENLNLVLGSGISATYGLPSWDDLLQRLLMKTIDKNHEETELLSSLFRLLFNPSPLIAGRYLQESIGDEKTQNQFEKEVRNALYSSYNSNASSPIMDEIIKLCISPGNSPKLDSIITYNYDNIIEKELKKIEMEIPFQSVYGQGINPDNKSLAIYHVHGYLPEKGKIKNHNSITLGEYIYHEQYINTYSWNNIVQINKFRDKTCLFIGTSLSDPNIRRLLDIANSQKNNKKYHYILKKRPEKEWINGMLIKIFENNNDLQKIKENTMLNVDEIVDFLIEMQNRFEERDSESLGVKTVWIDDYDEDITEILKEIRKAK